MPENIYKNVTATGAIKATPGRLVGMYVNSTSAGTIKLWDSLTASGSVINNTITPAIGFHNLGNVSFNIGLFATITGTIDVTFIYG